MRDEVAQSDISDAESISGDGIREPRRSKGPSDPTLREIEDHALTGHASFQSWCAAYCSGGISRGAQSCNCGWVDAKIQDRSQPHRCSALCRQSSFPKRLSTLFRTTLAVDHTIGHSTPRLLQLWTFSWRSIQQSLRRQIPQCYCPIRSMDICRQFIVVQNGVP